MRKTAVTFRGRRVTMFDLGEHTGDAFWFDALRDFGPYGLRAYAEERKRHAAAESMFTAPWPHVGVSREKPKAPAPKAECPHYAPQINTATMRYVCRDCGATADAAAFRLLHSGPEWIKPSAARMK